MESRYETREGSLMKTRMMTLAALFLIALALSTLAFTDASARKADLEYRGWGVRGGMSSSPDQFFLGGHVDLGQFAPDWHFIPNADIGFGDHVTIFSINPDVTYHWPVQDVGSIYAGGLFALQWWHRDTHDVHSDDSEAELGLHGLAGLVLDSAPVFFELNVGLLDAPDVKFAVGYTFLK